MTAHLSRLGERFAPLFLSAIALDCASVSAHGIIKTPDGNPVTDASLTLTEPETGKLTARASTDLRGCFSVYHPVKSGDRSYVLRISSPGHKPVVLTTRMSEKPILLVTLIADQSSEESTSRPILPEERYVLYDAACAPEVRGAAVGLR